MKEIQLTQGKVALVDDEDFEYLNQFNWHILKCKSTFYANRRPPRNKKPQKALLMHRVILDVSPDKQIDHIDHNGLNNQKDNLRTCTRAQNQMNTRGYGKSKYKGVTIYYDTRRGNNTKRITAKIRLNGIRYNLGHFRTEESAAKAYDIKAKELHGEFANLNFK